MDGGRLDLTVNVQGAAVLTPPGGVVNPVTAGVPGAAGVALAFGTAAGQFNLVTVQDRELLAGADETLDLYDGSVLDVFGDPAPFRKVKLLAVWVTEGGDADGLTAGGGSSNPFVFGLGGTTPTQTTVPGGVPVLAGTPAGLAVDATHRTLKVTNNGAEDLTYRLLVAGTDA